MKTIVALLSIIAAFVVFAAMLGGCNADKQENPSTTSAVAVICEPCGQDPDTCHCHGSCGEGCICHGSH